ncbi:MAG: PhoH family protein [Actinomycetes bacterium]
MPRTYVLDTSVLLSDPNAIRGFAEHSVIVPVVVIRELERKRDDPTLGHNARTVLRSLEALRMEHGSNLRSGVVVNESGGTLRIEINHVDTSHLPESVRADRGNDTRILSVAAALRGEGHDVVVVSKDLPLRLLAHGALGIPAEEYRREQVADSGYTGLVEIETSRESVDELYSQGSIPLESHDIPVNTGVVLLSPTTSALGRVTDNKEIAHVRGDIEAFGVHGRSAEQRIALSHLLNPQIGIVSLGGMAGTGKSVLALAAALELVLERRSMRRIFVFRPIIAVGGQELGYLPGNEEEKMSPWGAAVFDALRSITTVEAVDEVRARGLLEILPLTHIRGRTLGPDDLVIVDECQNLERSTILTAISRLGERSKILLLHDVAQRDTLRVGRHDGIAAVVERLKGESLFAHVTLTRSERSPVAALATRLLDDGLS